MTNADATRALVDRAAAIGGPVTITSLGRSAARNAAVGGSSSSQHLTDSAADIVPKGVSAATWFERVLGELPANSFGQLILYPSDGHVHISLPNRASGITGEALRANVGPGFITVRAGTKNGVTVAAGTGDPEGAATWVHRILYVLAALFLIGVLTR